MCIFCIPTCIENVSESTLPSGKHTHYIRIECVYILTGIMNDDKKIAAQASQSIFDNDHDDDDDGDDEKLFFWTVY